MMRSLYSGISGLKVHQIQMDVIGNNIANVNTIAYKSSRVTFQEILNQTLKNASAPSQIGDTGYNRCITHTYRCSEDG
jgi:flagellar hook protein FlgE